MCDACTTRNETKQSKEMRKNTKKKLSKSARRVTMEEEGNLADTPFFKSSTEICSQIYPPTIPNKKIVVCQAVNKEETFVQHAEGTGRFNLLPRQVELRPSLQRKQNQENRVQFGRSRRRSSLILYVYSCFLPRSQERAVCPGKHTLEEVVRRFALLFCLWSTTYKI
ncbi:Hypothetical protein, putative [Bodo saltans]|uniref:Uncharacterized protein n=1 Tax=Bodo saltans TaxID=75058 RepID=A0A0S4JMH8_BODSA|nr:Hypothetical protein, putative [Bodo saltans]|eukprot:CUG91112.1 Hypothetical protein, putative [Bodo saltans]